ncbi:MAG: site-2 protease family protein [Candidatus Hydrothermarchaeota archaeon]
MKTLVEIQCLCGNAFIREFKPGDYIGKPEKCSECKKEEGRVSKIYEEDVEEVLDPEDFKKILQIVKSEFNVEEYFFRSNGVVFTLKEDRNTENRFLNVYKKLRFLNYVPWLKGQSDRGITLSVFPHEMKSNGKGIIWNIGLLILTFGTCTLAGYLWFSNGKIENAILFAVSLLAVIGAHEMAHAYMSWRHGVASSLPYFIPAPPFMPLGTFGAIISTRSPIPNKKALFDIGISGPLAGFLISLLVLALGLAHSEITTKSNLENALMFELPPVEFPQLGSVSLPLALNILEKLILGKLPEDAIIQAHPLFWSGLFGLLITMLNLVPAGQLDGGHIWTSILNKKEVQLFTFLFALIMLAMGWWLWVLIIIVMNHVGHPGPLDEVSDVGGFRKVASILVFIMLLLSISSIPIMHAA